MPINAAVAVYADFLHSVQKWFLFRRDVHENIKVLKL